MPIARSQMATIALCTACYGSLIDSTIWMCIYTFDGSGRRAACAYLLCCIWSLWNYYYYLLNITITHEAHSTLHIHHTFLIPTANKWRRSKATTTMAIYEKSFLLILLSTFFTSWYCILVPAIKQCRWTEPLTSFVFCLHFHNTYHMFYGNDFYHYCERNDVCAQRFWSLP